MIDPHALLDAYAAESVLDDDSPQATRRESAPSAFDALHAVLDIHRPFQPYPQVPDVVWCAGCSKEGVYDRCPTVIAVMNALKGVKSP